MDQPLMTHNTKNRIVVFAFATLLMAMPLANSAFADGDATLDPTCGVTIPGTISLGSFSAGADGTEVESSMATTGSQAGTLELSASDWTGVGQNARGSVLLVGVVATETITINGLVYTAVAGAKADNTQFSIDTSMVAAATDLAASINADVRAGTLNDVSATSTENLVFLEQTVVGTGGDATTLAEAVADAGTLISGATFTGGENSGVVHMQSEVTRYVITTDGTASTGVAYASKTPIEVASTNKVLTIPAELTDPAQNVRLSLQVSGDGTLENLPYDGVLQQTLTFTVTCQ
ncbi:hypothetical protein [Nitrosopumilus adriaticus]|uniref:hypothetical protein n=1 Tax=Nitrosopumilus adriaticus TaxID=1580092 RepID=UPI00352CB8AD